MARKTFTTSINEKLQVSFKDICTANGEKMNDVLEAFMSAYIAGEFLVEKKVSFELKKAK